MTAGIMLCLAGGSLIGYALSNKQYPLVLTGICIAVAGFLIP